ncbi:MAG: dockerin type I domain-containing protein, partial [Candidatus Bathyarchaeota archaeon]|nr:dockerin type I domain-containing protein [Candidatus Bathyarchaeota archaeon]
SFKCQEKEWKVKMRSKIISEIVSMLLVACMLSIVLFSFSLRATAEEPTPVPYFPDPCYIFLWYENETWFMNVNMTVPFLGVIVSWGTAEVWNNESWANAEMWYPDPIIPCFEEVVHKYSLGKLQPGEYTFTFKVWDTPLKDIRFMHTYKSVDINGDGIVNIYDLATAAKAYGLVIGDPEYNPEADLNQDGRVDMRDLIVICRHWGEDP